MSKLNFILSDMISDHINLGQDKESDTILRADMEQAVKEIKDVLREYVGTADIPNWDYEDGMCNTCDFQPTDDTRNCICIFRNQLKDEIKARISKL